jgi:hypothetical protein
MLTISELKREELSDKLFEAIRSEKLMDYIDEIKSTGEMFIPETLPTLRTIITEELAMWHKKFYEIPSSSDWLTGLTLYFYFINHADKVPEEIVQAGLGSDLGFNYAITEMMRITQDISMNVVRAQMRFDRSCN